MLSVGIMFVVIGLLCAVCAALGYLAAVVPDKHIIKLGDIFKIDMRDDDFVEEYSQAVKDLQQAHERFDHAAPEYVDSAAYEIKAKEEKFNAMLREYKRKLKA